MIDLEKILESTLQRSKQKSFEGVITKNLAEIYWKPGKICQVMLK